MRGKTPFAGDAGIYVIAEIGKNFIQSKEERPQEEYLRNAKDLIDAAADAGADAVKFQTHEVEDEQLNIDVTSPHFQGADRFSWVTRNTNATPRAFWEEVKDHADQRGITFFSTPMSRNAARKIDDLVAFWKVGSGDVQDYVLLNELIRSEKPIIISTGMVSLAELDDVVAYLTKAGTELAILYCISHYPCPKEDFNLSTLALFAEKYPEAKIGFSDHSLGYDAALAAASLDATIIEKHFSLSRDLWGSDHKVSMTPKEMTEMVEALRNSGHASVDTTPYLGEKEHELEGASNPFRPYFGKKLVAAMDLSEGTVLEEEHVYAMRPAKEISGLEAKNLPEVLGKVLARNVEKYDPIASDSLR